MFLSPRFSVSDLLLIFLPLFLAFDFDDFHFKFAEFNWNDPIDNEMYKIVLKLTLFYTIHNPWLIESKDRFI